MEKYDEGLLPAVHVAREWNPSDIGTKGLAGSRHWKLCNLLGLKIPQETIWKVRVRSEGRPATMGQCLRAVILPAA